MPLVDRAEIRNTRVRKHGPMVQNTVPRQAQKILIYLAFCARPGEPPMALQPMASSRMNSDQINAEMSRQSMQLPPRKRIATLRERMSVRDVSLDQRPDEGSKVVEALDNRRRETPPTRKVQAARQHEPRGSCATHSQPGLISTACRRASDANRADYICLRSAAHAQRTRRDPTPCRRERKSARSANRALRKLATLVRGGRLAVEDEAGAVPVG